MMTVTSHAQKIVEKAVSQLGTAEATGKNDGAPAINYAGGRQEPWCAHFVAWCYREAGQPIPGDIVPSLKRANPLASVQHMERVFREHDWMLVDPAPGDVVFFRTRMKSDPNRYGRHCGIVETVSQYEIGTVEGNTSNRVMRRKYARKSEAITGYGRIPDA